MASTGSRTAPGDARVMRKEKHLNIDLGDLMRKVLSAILTLWCVFIYSCSLTAADSWESYMHLMAKYYSWGNQDMERVSCRITLSTLTPENIRAHLESRGKNVAIDENMNDFTVAYNKKDGISFIKPRFKVTILFKEGVKNPDQFELGVRMMNEGAQMQIEGSITMIKGVLQAFIPPTRESLKDTEVSSDGAKTILKYEKDKVSSTQIYAGDTRTTKTRTTQGEFETTEQFTHLKGKLALATNTTSIHQGENTTNMTTTIKYQDLGRIFFPSIIEQHTRTSDPNLKQEVEMKITFTDCKVE